MSLSSTGGGPERLAGQEVCPIAVRQRGEGGAPALVYQGVRPVWTPRKGRGGPREDGGAGKRQGPAGPPGGACGPVLLPDWPVDALPGKAAIGCVSGLFQPW